VRVPGLAHRHRRHADLPVAHADVVGDRVTGDDRARVGRTDATAALADHDGELAFIVDLLRFGRTVHDVEGPAGRGRLLVEDHRDGRDRHAAFFGVRTVVQTDREDFRRPGDRRLEADLRERDATRGGNGRPRPGHRAIAVLEQREHRVRHGSGKIRDLVAYDGTNLRATFMRERCKLHRISPLSQTDHPHLSSVSAIFDRTSSNTSPIAARG